MDSQPGVAGLSKGNTSIAGPGAGQTVTPLTARAEYYRPTRGTLSWEP